MDYGNQPMMQPGMINTGLMGQPQNLTTVVYWKYSDMNGFQKLEQDQGLLMKQRLVTIHKCCRWTTFTRQYLYPLAEDGKSKKSSMFLKALEPADMKGGCCLPVNCYPFKMHVQHKDYNNLANDGKEFLVLERDCSCNCFTKPDLKVVSKEQGSDTYLGKISTPCCHCCGIEFLVKDDTDSDRYKVVEPCCQMAILCPCCGGDPVFEIKDNSDNVVGNIGKCTQVRPDGDCCTKECNTYVTFPPQSSGKDRALLTATGIWIASTVLQTVRSTKHSLYM